MESQTSGPSTWDVMQHAMLRDDPFYRPIVDLVEDSNKYIRILRGVLWHVEFLSGRPCPGMQGVYDKGHWIPAMSRVRYGLLCVALKCPEFEEPYHAFCCAVEESGVTLDNFPDRSELAGVRKFIENEIRRHEV